MGLRTRPTRRFGLLCTVLLLVVLGIITTRNNILYIVFAIYFLLALRGWLGPARSPRLLKVTCTALPRGYAGRTVSLRFELRNAGLWMRLPEIVMFQPAAVPEAGRRALFVGSLPPRGRISFEFPLLLEKRGLHSLPGPVFRTGFPAGLFRREWESPPLGEILVYPRVVSVREVLLEGEAVNVPRPSAVADPDRDLVSLRLYREGDDVRRLNWKATARRGEPVISEYNRREKRARVALYLDISGGTAEERERAISLTASLAVFFHDRGRLVKLVTSRGMVHFGRSERKRNAILELLARLGPEDERPLAARGLEGPLCLDIAVYAGERPRRLSGMDVWIGPRDFGRYAPALRGKGKA